MRKMSFDEYKLKASVKHKNFYTYPDQVYQNQSNKIIIICPEHGEFQQKASGHLSGYGCPKCSKNKISINQPTKLTTEEFIDRSKIRHDDYYMYTSTNYQSMHKKVTIICPEHGEFSQKPDNHLRGSGCPVCGIKKASDKKRKPFKSYLLKFQGQHSNKYKYKYPDNENYYGSSSHIVIICPEHGEFQQSVDNHLQGHGCPKCAISGFNPDKEATLYYLYDPQEDLYKIGITNKDASSRFGAGFIKERGIRILMEESYSSGEQALLAEQEILGSFESARTINPTWPEALGGKTEFFNRNILEL